MTNQITPLKVFTCNFATVTGTGRVPGRAGAPPVHEEHRQGEGAQKPYQGPPEVSLFISFRYMVRDVLTDGKFLSKIYHGALNVG